MSFPNNGPMFTRVSPVVLLAVIYCLAAPCFALTRISITADEISSASLNAKRVAASVRLTEPAGELSVKFGEISSNGKRLADTEISCVRLTITTTGISCKEGKLKQSGEIIPLTFQFANSKTFSIALQSKNESWQINSRLAGSDWNATLDVKNGAVMR
ncbi:MAG: hypothetical protein M3Q00_10950, partial [Pseudomonadota bacterium]|nr:hypothetical protein [Pseudomonadota bacterium]